MLNDVILKFIREDISGILITDEDGNVLYEDEETAFVREERTNWKAACPTPRPDQHAELWDLLWLDGDKMYMVVTSTFTDEGKMDQIHHLVDTSMYMDLYRDITGYSKELKNEKDHDSLTGLYNKGKFMELRESLFRGQQTIAVFNMDVNNLKEMNDTYGHEWGDKLIRKAADSLKAIEARNVIPFRVGGDEFFLIAIHIKQEDVDKIRRKWEEALARLNSLDDGVSCVIACGVAFGEGEYDFEQIFALADQRMYEDKKRKKELAGQTGINPR